MTRRVAKLRLSAPDEALNQRGAILIEDALRTASLPFADSARLLVIRKLPLGRIRATDAPSTIALRIEAQCRGLVAGAVHALSPSAPAASAVYFDDDGEAFTLLAIHLARGQPAYEWFWPLAVRGWTPAMPLDEAMRVIMAGTLASSAGPMAVLVFVRALLRHRSIDVLASALQHHDGVTLLRAFGWSAPAVPPAFQEIRSAGSASVALAEIVRPWIAFWGRDDARSLWLACVLQAVERPALATQAAELPAIALAWIVECLATLDDPPPRALPVSTAAESQLVTSVTPATTTEEIHRGAEDEPTVVRSIDRFTTSAGLFCLLPALRRLGMPAWLEEHPTLACVPHLVLRTLAMRLGTPLEDPVCAALEPPPEEISAEAMQAVFEWIRRLRRFCRLSARIGLHSLIRRPGRIAFTETHIDVQFEWERLDIRIRRAGLDLDPGWLPWFSRVVRFRYVPREVIHA